jgi:hypothetical protein
MAQFRAAIAQLANLVEELRTHHSPIIDDASCEVFEDIKQLRETVRRERIVIAAELIMPLRIAT